MTDPQPQTTQTVRPLHRVALILHSNRFFTWLRVPPGKPCLLRRRASRLRSAVNCEGDNCYYLEYAFQIVDAQGTAHDVKCEWDVDSHRRTAAPRNEQARYYWTAAVPGWSK
jgi:hypothetical protein